jgi:hypothetical protein
MRVQAREVILASKQPSPTSPGKVIALVAGRARAITQEPTRHETLVEVALDD